MRTDELVMAILAFAGVVAVVPAWSHYVLGFTGARNGAFFLASLVMPAMLAMFITSWVKPELSGLVLGGSLLVGVMVMAPHWVSMIELGVSGLTEHPLARLFLRLAVPLLILSYVISLGRRRMSAG